MSKHAPDVSQLKKPTGKPPYLAQKLIDKNKTISMTSFLHYDVFCAITFYILILLWVKLTSILFFKLSMEQIRRCSIITRNCKLSHRQCFGFLSQVRVYLTFCSLWKTKHLRRHLFQLCAYLSPLLSLRRQYIFLSILKLAILNKYYD